MKFDFRAKDDNGAEKEGVVEAMNWTLAAQTLEKNGLTPISIKEQARSSGLAGLEHIWEGVSQKELVTFFQQLAVLIEARVPVVSSLDTVSEQMGNRYFRLIVREMSDDIEDGMPFSEALERHPDIFSPLTISMIRAGEVSGSLQKSIAYVAENIEKNYQLMARIRGALYYPMFVLGVASLVAFLVVTFILPKITLIIKDMKVDIPWYTAALISLGDFMSAYWPAVAMVIIAAIGTFVYYIRTDSGKREWEIIVLKLPVIGLLAKDIYVTRLAENLSALLNGGIPVVRALVIVSEVVGNHVFAEVILQAAEEVKSGGTMSSMFAKHKRHIPPIVAQMIRIGEETGTLSRVLESVSKFYDQEVDNMTRTMTALLEPFLIVLLGIGVGILVVGVLMPIYNIAGQL